MTVPIRSMPEEKYELYRVITDYEALQDGFLDRLDDLDTTMSLPSFADGAVQKLLSKNPGKPSHRKRDCRIASARRTFGWESLGKMLEDTGLALVLVVDDERFAPLKEQLAKRKRPLMRSTVRTMRPKWLFNSEKASKARKKGWEDVPPETRKKIMRKVAKARWRKRRRKPSTSGSPVAVGAAS